MAKYTPRIYVPYTTPSTFETPDGGSASPSCSQSKHRATKEDGKEGEKAEEKDLPSLDRFLAKSTSEDNASFEQIMELVEDKDKLRHAWLYEAENEYNERNRRLSAPRQEWKHGSTRPKMQSCTTLKVKKTTRCSRCHGRSCTRTHGLMLIPSELRSIHSLTPQGLSPAVLSPALQRLVNRSSSKYTDKALRASYTPSPAHRIMGSKTPLGGPATPSITPTPGKARTPATQDPASITENLLQLPKRRKASDYF
ncbi:protein DGCR14-like [Sinocyclocheilus grahami]|uniref:protein DGCR14-like n=1 Tax=Sinocyclocheilus grahami TaxID=75366 RepID=UPI0007ACF8A6|nr:PREDICTED: protein DGCR14-like [Sinocyclocheilus grahami]